MFVGLQDYNINRLQNAQNSAARLVKHQSKFCHITPLLKELYWLQVYARIHYYEICLLVYNCQHNLALAPRCTFLLIFHDRNICTYKVFKVLEGLFLEWKKSKFTGDLPHWDGLNLYNFGMDLFLIIFVNFKTPCLHGNSS